MDKNQQHQWDLWHFAELPRVKCGMRSASKCIQCWRVYCCMNLLGDSCITSQLESRLNKYSFLSRFNLPGYSDGIIFQFLNHLKKYPDQKKYPNFYHWYILIKQFAPQTIGKWIQDRLYYCAQDELINSFVEVYSQADDLKRVPQPAPLNLEGSKSLNVKTARKKAAENVYAIHILLKENSDKQFEQLRRCLSNYTVGISRSDRGEQAIISCKEESSKCQQLVNTISNSIQFLNLRIKKQRKLKTQLL